MKILVHLTQGAENPTVASLALLISRTALEEGHEVSLFLAGDAVGLMRDAVLDNVSGLGTGNLREHYEFIVKAGGQFYMSGNSSKARGLAEGDITGKPVRFAPPSVLLKLAIESDRMFVY